MFNTHFKIGIIESTFPFKQLDWRLELLTNRKNDRAKIPRHNFKQDRRQGRKFFDKTTSNCKPIPFSQ